MRRAPRCSNAGVRKRELARRADEQPSAQERFKIRDFPAQRRQRPFKAVCGEASHLGTVTSIDMASSVHSLFHFQ